MFKHPVYCKGVNHFLGLRVEDKTVVEGLFRANLPSMDPVTAGVDGIVVLCGLGIHCTNESPAKSGADCIRIPWLAWNDVLRFDCLNTVIADEKANFEVFTKGRNLLCTIDWRCFQLLAVSGRGI